MEENSFNYSIILISDCNSPTQSILQYAAILVEIFQSNIVWFHVEQVSRKLNSENSNHNQNKKNITHLFINKQELSSIHNRFDEHNGIMCIMEVNKSLSKLNYPKNILKLVRKSRIPFLLIQDKTPHISQFENIVLPIDFLQQTKEKALWASYFYSYNKSTIHVIQTRYKDEYYRLHAQNNMKFVERMYANLNVLYQKEMIENSNHKLDIESIEYAAKIDAGLVVIMTTLDYNIDDVLFGPPESKLIQNKFKIPILCLNQRDDLYVLCS